MTWLSLLKNAQWNSAIVGNFVTHQLVHEGSAFIYKPTPTTRVMVWIPTIVAGIILYAPILEIAHDIRTVSLIELVRDTLFNPLPWIGGLALLWLGRYFFKLSESGAWFDTIPGRFYIVRPPTLRDLKNLSVQYDEFKFSDVQGIAVSDAPLRENSASQSYEYYELSLDMKDGTKKNLVAHPDIQLIRKEAEMLAQLLDVPVGKS